MRDRHGVVIHVVSVSGFAPNFRNPKLDQLQLLGSHDLVELHRLRIHVADYALSGFKSVENLFELDQSVLVVLHLVDFTVGSEAANLHQVISRNMFKQIEVDDGGLLWIGCLLDQVKSRFPWFLVLSAVRVVNLDGDCEYGMKIGFLFVFVLEFDQSVSVRALEFQLEGILVDFDGFVQADAVKHAYFVKWNFLRKSLPDGEWLMLEVHIDFFWAWCEQVDDVSLLGILDQEG